MLKNQLKKLEKERDYLTIAGTIVGLIIGIFLTYDWAFTLVIGMLAGVTCYGLGSERIEKFNETYTLGGNKKS